MYALVKLSASSDPNPINITVRRLNAVLHDVNGVDMEEADGETLSPPPPSVYRYERCMFRSSIKLLYARILHRANTGRGLRMSPVYGHIYGLH